MYPLVVAMPESSQRIAQMVLDADVDASQIDCAAVSAAVKHAKLVAEGDLGAMRSLVAHHRTQEVTGAHRRMVHAVRDALHDLVAREIEEIDAVHKTSLDTHKQLTLQVVPARPACLPCLPCPPRLARMLGWPCTRRR